MLRSHPTVSVSRRTAFASLGAGGVALALASRGLIATAQEATPAATTFSTFDHPMVGTWQWTSYPDTASEFFSVGVFTEDGRYAEFSNDVLIGVWRATGERTAEVVMNRGMSISLQAAFEPQYVIEETCLVSRDAVILRIMIEIDATGISMTGTGAWELLASDNRIVKGNDLVGTGDRMRIASDTRATPTS